MVPVHAHVAGLNEYMRVSYHLTKLLCALNNATTLFLKSDEFPQHYAFEFAHTGFKYWFSLSSCAI